MAQPPEPDRRRPRRRPGHPSRPPAGAPYQALVDLCPDPIVVYQDGRLVFANAAAARLAGAASPEQLMGRGILDFVHPGESPDARARFARRPEAAPPARPRDHRVLALDGRELYLETVQVPIRFGGRPAVQVAVRDVSARKRAEHALQEARQELERRVAERTAELTRANQQLAREVGERRLAELSLRESELRFRRVFEDGPLGMAVVALDLSFVCVNARLCAMLGYGEAELLQRTFLEITHPDDLPADYRVIARLRRGEMASHTWEKRYLHRSGEVVPARVTGALLHGDDGRPLYGLALVEDIRERRRAEEELRAVEVRLQRSARLASIGTLASGIAHEINNPVGSILLATRCALGELSASGTSAVLSECLRDIEAEAQRCARIVKGLQQFARSEPSQKWPDDLNRCARAACALAGGERGAALALELCPGELPVRMNPGEIEQALGQVIRNALEEGGGVGVRTERADGKARVIVEDAGRGMGEEERAHLFDPFYTTRREEGGVGLGLSIAHGLVSAHGGSIDVESAPGRGTRVVVALPLLPETPAQARDG